MFIEKRSLWLITLPVFILILEVWRLFVFLLSFQKRTHKLIDREGKGFTSQNTFLINNFQSFPKHPPSHPLQKKGQNLAPNMFGTLGSNQEWEDDISLTQPTKWVGIHVIFLFVVEAQGSKHVRRQTFSKKETLLFSLLYCLPVLIDKCIRDKQRLSNISNLTEIINLLQNAEYTSIQQFLLDVGLKAKLQSVRINLYIV